MTGETAVVRLAATDIKGSSSGFTFTAVTVARQSGATETISGSWRLPLTTPSDLPQRLLVEHLVRATATDQGVEVIVEGAVRSLLETLVTIRVEGPANLQPVGNPWLLRNGELVAGGLVAEDGNRYTYSFPATSFGSTVEVRLGPFTIDGSSGANGVLRLNVGAILARGAATSDEREPAPVIPSDVVAGSDDLLKPHSVYFSSRGEVRNGAESIHPFFGIVLEGILGDAGPSGDNERGPARPFTASGAKGAPLDAQLVSQGYRQDIAGNIHSPETQVGLFYDSLEDLDGVITLNFLGDTQDLVRGDWSVRLSPQP